MPGGCHRTCLGNSSTQENRGQWPKKVAEWPTTCLTHPKPQAPSASGSVRRGACARKMGCVADGHCQSSHHLATRAPSGARTGSWRGALGYLLQRAPALSLECPRLPGCLEMPPGARAQKTAPASLQPGGGGPGRLMARQRPRDPC